MDPGGEHALGHLLHARHHLADLFLDIRLVDHQLGLKTVESIRYEIMSLGELGLYPGHQIGDPVRGMAMVRGNKAMNNALQRLIFEFPIFGLRSEQPRQSPIEGHLDKGVCIKISRRVAGGHHQLGVGQKKKIEDIIVGAGPQIQHHIVGIQLPYGAHQFQFAGKGQIGRSESTAAAADEARSRIGLHGYGIQSVGLLVEIVIDPMLECPNAHVKMEIGGPQIQVHQNRTKPSPGQIDAKVGGQY